MRDTEPLAVRPEDALRGLPSPGVGKFLRHLPAVIARQHIRETLTDWPGLERLLRGFPAELRAL